MTVCMAPCPVVFDLDGTLIDSAPDIHACVNEVLAQHNLPILNLQQVRSFIGGGVDILWKKVIHALDLPAESQSDFVASFMTRYHEATALTRLFPGVTEALGLLADRGYPLGICTNKPLAATQPVLDHFGITSIFSCIIAGDTLPEKKPDPAPLRLAFELLGADPRAPRGLYVGDSEFDASCAAAVPVPFLIYSRGYRQAPLEELTWQAQFEDFTALPGLIETWAPA